LAKDLSPIHPRRLYFYLTTTPHQPIPEVAAPLPEPHRIISPSLSSASAADEEERYSRRRTQLSPSPEVDLSSPELDEENVQQPPTPGAPFSARNSTPGDSRSSSSLSQHRRAASPQLEREERDFKQTASQLYEEAQQRRRNSSQPDVNMDPTSTPTTAAADASASAADRPDASSVTTSIEAEHETEESAARRNSDDVAALFGHAEHLLFVKRPESVMPHLMDFSSPVIQPRDHNDGMESGGVWSVEAREEEEDVPMETITSVEHEQQNKNTLTLLPEPALFGWEDGEEESLQSPENVEVAELDDMFDAY